MMRTSFSEIIINILKKQGSAILQKKKFQKNFQFSILIIKFSCFYY